MVDCFLFRYFCTSSDDRPGQEVEKFFLLLLTTRIEWVFSIMRGENPQVCLFIFTHKHVNPPVRALPVWHHTVKPPSVLRPFGVLSLT